MLENLARGSAFVSKTKKGRESLKFGRKGIIPMLLRPYSKPSNLLSVGAKASAFALSAGGMYLGFATQSGWDILKNLAMTLQGLGSQAN